MRGWTRLFWALAIFAGACSPATERGPSTVEVPPAKAPAWAAERQIAEPPFPEDVPSDHGLLVVLPTQHVGPHHIHPGLLRAFDRAVAGYAGAFLGQLPMAPQQVKALWSAVAPEPGPGDGPAPADPQALVAEAARRAGTRAVALPVLGADGRLVLHVHPGAPAPLAQWAGAGIQVHEPDTDVFDLPHALYTGPVALLRALAATDDEPGEPLRALVAAPSAEAEAAFARAERLLWSGRHDAMVRAERELAALALAHPHWPAPWVALATQAVLWTRIHYTGGESGMLYESSAPARVLARALVAPGGPDAAMLDALDLMMLEAGVREGDLERVLRALPRRSPLRALLAVQHGSRARDLFGLEGVDASTPLAGFFVATGAVGAGREEALAAQAWAAEHGEDAFAMLPVIDAFAGGAMRAGEWTDEQRTALAVVPPSLAGAWERQRSICRDLDASGLESGGCWSALSAGLAAFALPTELPRDPEALADDATWEALAAALPRRVFDAATLERNEGVLPPDSDTIAPWSRASWLVASELVASWNEVRREASSTLRPAFPSELLGAEARRRHVAMLDRIFFAAWLPGEIGGVRRGQADEAAPYLVSLAPFGADFPMSDWTRAKVLAKADRHEEAGAIYEEGFASDPFDPLWLGAHLRYLQWRWGRTQDTKGAFAPGPEAEYEEAKRFVATLVPRTNAIESWLGYFEEDSRERLEASLRRRFDLGVAGRLDGILAPTAELRPERIALLERVREVFPLAVDRQLVLADLYLASGRTGEALAIAQGLRGQAGTHESACRVQARAQVRQGQARAGEETLRECAAEASSDKWRKARLLVSASRAASARGAYLLALGDLEEARGLIGGAGDILLGIANATLWGGDPARAEKLYRMAAEQYPGGSAFYNQLALVQLRDGRVDEAQATMESAHARVERTEVDDYVTGSIFAQRDDLAGFRAYLEARGAWNGARAYAVTHARSLGDAAALAVLEDILSRNATFAPALRGRALYLGRLGRWSEALPALREEVERNPDDWNLRWELVRGLAETGELAEAERVVAEYAELHPGFRNVYLLRSFVDGARGRRAEALAAVDRARSMFPFFDVAVTDEVYFLEQVLQREIALGGLDDPERAERMLADARHVANLRYWEPRSWERLAELAEQLGRSDEADAARAVVARWAPSRGQAAAQPPASTP